MARVAIDSEKLNKLLSQNGASRAAKDRAARALLSEQDKEILAIADYVSLVMRDIRNVPRYSALPSSGWREDSRWKLYERLYKFCREWEIDPKLWIDAQTHFIRKILNVADDSVYITAMTSVRERAMEIFDEYTETHAEDIMYLGAKYDRERRTYGFQTRRSAEIETAFNIVTGRVDDASLLILWKQAIDEWNDHIRKPVSDSAKVMGAVRAKRFNTESEFFMINRILIPFFPSGRIWASKEDSEIVSRLSAFYLNEKSGLFPEIRNYWLDSEEKRNIPHKILGWLSAKPEFAEKFGSRGLDMNLLYDLPSLPFNDELKGVTNAGQAF